MEEFDELLADSKKGEIKAGITARQPDEMHVNKFNEKGSKFRSVPFAQPGERYASVLGGHADVLVEQAGDVRSFLDAKQMRPIVFFADKPQVGYEDVPLASKYGVNFAISQFRSVVGARAPTPRREVLSAALERGAFRGLKNTCRTACLRRQLHPADKAGAFIAEQLALIERTCQKDRVREPENFNSSCACGGWRRRWGFKNRLALNTRLKRAGPQPVRVSQDRVEIMGCWCVSDRSAHRAHRNSPRRAWSRQSAGRRRGNHRTRPIPCCWAASRHRAS